MRRALLVWRKVDPGVRRDPDAAGAEPVLRSSARRRHARTDARHPRRSTSPSSRIGGADGCDAAVSAGCRRSTQAARRHAPVRSRGARRGRGRRSMGRATWDPRKARPGFFLDAMRCAASGSPPNYDGWFAGVPVHINSLGFRDRREYRLAKRPNTFRILVLGDSVTFGHGSVSEHTYPCLLEAAAEGVAPRRRLAGVERRGARLQHQPGAGAAARSRSAFSARSRRRRLLRERSRSTTTP